MVDDTAWTLSGSSREGGLTLDPGGIVSSHFGIDVGQATSFTPSETMIGIMSLLETASGKVAALPERGILILCQESPFYL